jgi:hypothetical protein
MSHQTEQSTSDRAATRSAHAVLEIAAGLADGVHTLIPSATAAIVVAIESDWQLLAARGPIDIAATWLPAIADQVRDSDLPQQHGDYLVAPFSAVGMHALLIIATESREQMPRRAHAIVQPLLDAGGILLDRAIAVQERDRAVRRVVRLCTETNPQPARTLAHLERALASLWPGATARYHDRNELAGSCWSARRLVRVACDLGQPSIGRTPAYEGLMPRDMAYQVAIPVSALDGAILIEAPASGEELDTRSLATAISLVRDSEQAIGSEALPAARHA